MNLRRTLSMFGLTCSLLVLGGLPAGAAAAPAPTSAPVAAASPRSAATLPAGTGGRVVVRDISIRVPHHLPVRAYLVRPRGPAPAASRAGVLWLHWLGQIHSDRTEFLSEAITLADQAGVVSVLPQGTFPWSVAPSGDRSDLTKISRQVRAFRAALHRLQHVRTVDTSRVGIVGHDYGAMFAALVANRHQQVAALVLAAPDATWGNWFSTYWLGYTGTQRSQYARLFAHVNPVRHTARLGSHVLFQWAGSDIYVSARTRAAYATTSPRAAAILYPTADHQLTDAAAADRDAFLAEQLGLTKN